MSSSYTTTSTTSSNVYLLIEVPDYEQDAGWLYNSGGAKSYVQLGKCDGKGLPSGKLTDASSDYDHDGQDLIKSGWSALGDAFTDDSRYRGAGADVGGSGFDANSTPPNETSQRTTTGDYGSENETTTNLIPSYVGWRDHTDGHRISTTRGDKIEVIGGNYAIVSLGRGTGVSTFQMSGGLNVDSMEAPGNVTSITWRDCPTDSGNKGWKWVEQTTCGHNVDRYHGTVREEAYGDVIIAVTGAPDTISTGDLQRTDGDDGGEDTYIGGGSQLHTTRVGHLKTRAYPTRWDAAGGGAPAQLLKPEIYESTWAKKIVDYTECDGEIKEELVSKGLVTGYETYKKGADISLRVNSGRFSEKWLFDAGSEGFYEQFLGAFTQVFIGTETSVNIGVSTTFGLANRFEYFAGAETQMNTGGSFELAFFKSELELTGVQTRLSKLESNISDLKTRLMERRLLATREAVSLSDVQTDLADVRRSLNSQIG